MGGNGLPPSGTSPVSSRTGEPYPRRRIQGLMTTTRPLGRARGSAREPPRDRVDAAAAPDHADRARPRRAQLAGRRLAAAQRAADGEDRVVGMPDPRRDVLDAPHAGARAAHAQVQEDEDPVLAADRAARRGLVGEEVPLAEHDPAPAYAPDRLHDVDVLADDRGDRTRAGQ